ncbi:MAG: hypothetical protein KDC87_00755 [Planctomycetes bacterium]|nr:hypothetical protein [Planctomycetota bacterium]
MRDRTGRGIAPFDLWRSSMMANAARDPLWRAVLAAEIARTPSRRAEIEQKCMRCHAPMATPRGEQTTPAAVAILDDPKDSRHALARDGVSCTVCHRITAAGLGEARTFSGQFEISTDRAIFGPHAELFEHPMQRHTGFTPQPGAQIRKSALCGSCHTLDTSTLTADGKPTGTVFPEQSPYLEWRNSVFSDEGPEPGPAAKSCQDCHVPTTDADGETIRTAIAHNPGGRDWPFLGARAPFGRHVFVGGNTLIPEILRDNAEALGVDAPAAAFDRTIALAKQQLREKTARIAIEEVRRDAGALSFAVRVENLTGHKFPSAYPSRRAWLRVRVRAAGQRVVFESGGFDRSGTIVGHTGRPEVGERAGSTLQPHHQVITRPGQVQIYEAVLGDEAGAVTFTLMRAARHLKDNRLLPAGWRTDGPHADRTRPVGVDRDPDFMGGKDRVLYRIGDVPAGTLSVEVWLVYQTLGARFADELFQVDAPEVKRFRSFWAKATRTPVLVDQATHEVR